MGWSRPRDTAACLFDQHWRVVAADGLAQRRDQGADLRGRLAIAREQDEAQRISLGEEAPLRLAQAGGGAAENGGARGLIASHGVATASRENRRHGRSSGA